MEKDKNGSITIYLLLSLILILGLILTLAESSRVSLLNAKLKGITFMAADSCFGEYAKEVFDRYGIMALYKDESGFCASFSDYVNKNLNLPELDVYRDIDLFPAAFDACAIKNVTWMTDDGGEPFIKQACEYAELTVVKEVIEEILKSLGLIGEGSVISRFIDKVNSYRDVFVKVADTVSRIHTFSDRARSIAVKPVSLLGSMKDNMEMYAQTGNRRYIAQFNLDYWQLKESRDQMEWYIDNISAETVDYHINSESARIAADDIQDSIPESGGDYSEETLKAIRDQVELLREQSGNAGDDQFGIEENIMALDEYQQYLYGLDRLISDIPAEGAGEELMDHYQMVCDQKNIFTGFDTGRIGIEDNTVPVKKEDDGFLSAIGKIFTEGLLGAVTSGKISDNSIDRSRLSSNSVKKGRNSGSILQGAYRRLLLGEYVLSGFGDYIDQKADTKLKYEVEYVLGGKASDKENLYECAKDLVLLRAGLNAISFFKDPVKMGEAELLAAGIIGFTGMILLVELLKVVIISMWCLAESICDVKSLMGGGRAELVKGPADWTVSVAGLKNFAKAVVPSAFAETGMDYKDHLRLLMLFEGNQDIAFRSMDIIEANTREWYETDFSFSKCISSIEIETMFEARQLFSSFYFVSNIAGNLPGSYGLSFSQRYSY